MNKIILNLIFFILNFISFNAKSQDLLKIYQYDDSVTFFKKFVRDKLNTDSNYYVVILRPASCPRCEVSIIDFVQYLKDRGLTPPDLWIVDSRKEATFEYLDNRKLLINDTYFFENLLNYVYVNSGIFNVPLVVKFNSSGRIVSYFSLIGNFQANYRKIISQKKVKKLMKRKESRIIHNNDNSIFDLEKQIELDRKSKVGYFQKFVLSDTFLIIQDDINIDKLFIFSNITGKLLKTIEIDTILSKRYIKLDYFTYKWAIDNLLINSFINHFELDAKYNSSVIFLSLSLPYLVIDKGQLFSNNIPCLCKFSLYDYLVKIKDCQDILSIMDSINPLSPDHTNFYVTGANYIFSLEKGVPVVGNTLSDTVGGHNPFAPNFYFDVPLANLYDSNFLFKKRLGYLDSSVIRNRIGYSLNSVIMKSLDDQFILSDGFSNSIYVYSSDFDSVNRIEFEGRNPTMKNFKIRNSIDYLLSMDTIFTYKYIDIWVQDFSISILTRFNPQGMFGNEDQSIYYIDKFESGKLISTYSVPKIFKNCALRAVKFISASKIAGLYQNASNSYFLIFNL